jgi:hypothetical protein
VPDAAGDRSTSTDTPVTPDRASSSPNLARTWWSRCSAAHSRQCAGCVVSADLIESPAYSSVRLSGCDAHGSRWPSLNRKSGRRAAAMLMHRARSAGLVFDACITSGESQLPGAMAEIGPRLRFGVMSISWLRRSSITFYASCATDRDTSVRRGRPGRRGARSSYSESSGCSSYVEKKSRSSSAPGPPHVVHRNRIPGVKDTIG